MKTIALALVLPFTLGLVACSGSTDTSGSSTSTGGSTTGTTTTSGGGTIASVDEGCDDIGKACQQMPADVQTCKDGFATAKTQAGKVGCTAEFDAYVACALMNYKTPTAAECANEDKGFDPATCDTTYKAVLGCAQAACTKDPSKCQ